MARENLNPVRNELSGGLLNYSNSTGAELKTLSKKLEIRRFSNIQTGKNRFGLSEKGVQPTSGESREQGAGSRHQCPAKASANSERSPSVIPSLSAAAPPIGVSDSSSSF
ncbi:hypothetical protein SDJN02_20994, partial [Cucurbita argyrosperma subsp. argyrosperma]